MSREERLKMFLSELNRLREVYGFEIGGCGRCDSPYITELNRESGKTYQMADNLTWRGPETGYEVYSRWVDGDEAWCDALGPITAANYRMNKGQFIFTPVSLGDTIYLVTTKCYVIDDNVCDAYECENCPFDSECIVVEEDVTASWMCRLIFPECSAGWSLGRNVFLTKEEAIAEVERRNKPST